MSDPKQQLDGELEYARGQMYGFFAGVLLNRPERQMLEGLLSEDALAALQLVFPGHPAVKGLRRLASDCHGRDRLREGFLMDYEALFRVPGDAYTHPYESAYVADEGQEAGGKKPFLNTSRTRLVVMAYGRLGLAPGGDFDELPDHIGVQFDFVARLCHLVAEELDKGNMAKASGLKEQQESFLREHLLAWGSECLAKVESHASSELYRYLAGLGKTFLELERQAISA